MPTAVGGGKGTPTQDDAALLVAMDRKWSEVFRNTLGKAERSLVNELLDVRNRWAHQQPFSSDDTDRALDSIGRLLTALTATAEADEVGKMKTELRRLIFDEQMRSEKRKGAGTAIQGQASGTLKPWREVVTPHRDVASGRYQQAEFAADLWQVHLGEGTDECRDPAEFYRRTFLTESLTKLLSGAVQRLTGKGADPVIQLQTNFGGGKTHSMLALYHLFGGVKPGDLLGVDAILAAAGIDKLPKANRVVLVGNKISPGNPSKTLDGHLRDLVGSHEMRIKAINREVLERERDREMPIRKISPDHAVEFAAHARKILSEAKNPLVRLFLRALVSDILVTPTKVSLKAPKLYVAAAASRWDGKNLTESVPGFVSKWRAGKDQSANTRSTVISLA